VPDFFVRFSVYCPAGFSVAYLFGSATLFGCGGGAALSFFLQPLIAVREPKAIANAATTNTHFLHNIFILHSFLNLSLSNRSVYYSISSRQQNIPSPPSNVKSICGQKKRFLLGVNSADLLMKAD
jgi:hypothetical protein